MIDAEHWEERKLKQMDRDELVAECLVLFNMKNRALEDLEMTRIGEDLLMNYVAFLENKVTELQKKLAEVEYGN